jgi:hypothetical protein
MNNLDKQKRYSNLMVKLSKATNNEYYYEAIFLEYAIIEDRLESLLKHAGLKFKKDDGRNIEMNIKINKIKSGKNFQDKYIKKHLDNEFINRLDKWRDTRNKLIHNLVNIEYDDSNIKNLALEGECIAKRLNNKSKLINNYFDKMNNKKM